MNPRQWRTYLSEKFTYYRGLARANAMRFRRVDHQEGARPEDIQARNQLLERLERVYSTNSAALANYEGRFYPGKVILFNAEEQDPAIVVDPQYGWPGMAAEIETHIVPGNHDTILMEPGVKLLADKLTECLARSA
jgi:thioesterase domain-containing protein